MRLPLLKSGLCSLRISGSLKKHWVPSATCWAAKYVPQITVAQHSQNPTDAHFYACPNFPLSDTSQCSPKLQAVCSGNLPWGHETLMTTHHGSRKHYVCHSVICACFQRGLTGPLSQCSPVSSEGAHSLPLCQGNGSMGRARWQLWHITKTQENEYIKGRVIWARSVRGLSLHFGPR